ncbi:MAG: 50S ribosomal protein L22 [candidate division Zixibacteria bacterium RBG_16_50_21]|nr:MAG: 50S ribosomal protein L22 [candidate division Zixibacteria bacterium RBG_16_50_21]
MEAVARARYTRSSARKLRRVAELIKGQSVPKALATLSFTPKYAALVLEKTLKSAAANALARAGTAKLKAEDLVVKNVSVDGGPIMKRIRPVGMGRAYLIRKRLAHVTIRVAEDEKARKLREQQAKLATEKGKRKVTTKRESKAKEKKSE